MLITVPEAARRSGKNPETVRRWIRAGRLRSQKVGTQHLVDEQELLVLADDDLEQLPLPESWQQTFDGEPQPNWVVMFRRSRAGH